MSIGVRRSYMTFLLLLGAVVFGMVIAGGLQITPAGETAQAQRDAAQDITASAAPVGLPSFADLAERVSPAVASIQSTTIETASGPRRRQVDPFEFFFGPRGRGQAPPENDSREFRSDSGGSGFVISSDGLIVTNFHVINGATKLRVRLGDREYDAQVRGTDQATDIALLKIDAEADLPYLRLGDSEAVRVGDWAMAVGSPAGLADTVTVGVVSAKGRNLGIADGSFENFIQTDAAINFGNSGGPLLNLRGEVVGINTAINFGSENIGFAVPVNTLKQILPQLREEGRVRRGFLGINVQNLTFEAAQSFGLESSDGALVLEIMEDVPAEKAGLQHGDIIVSADDIKITQTRDLIEYVSGLGPDGKVDLGVIRNGKRITKRVELAERPSEEGATEKPEEATPSELDWLGIEYQDLSSSLRSNHGIPSDLQGVWISDVSPSSSFYEQLNFNRIINVISEVDGTVVESVRDFERYVQSAESGATLRFYVRRFAQNQQLAPLYVFARVP